jgi:hypothetical protein
MANGGMTAIDDWKEGENSYDGPTNTHTAYNYIFVSLTPLHVSMVKPPSKAGTKGHTIFHSMNNSVSQTGTMNCFLNEMLYDFRCRTEPVTFDAP